MWLILWYNSLNKKNSQTIESVRSDTPKKKHEHPVNIPLERISFVPIPIDPRPRRLLNGPVEVFLISPSFASNVPVIQERKRNSNLRPISFVRQQQRLRMTDPRLRSRDASALFGAPTKLPGEREMENGLPVFKRQCSTDMNETGGSAPQSTKSSSSEQFSSDEDGVYYPCHQVSRSLPATRTQCK